VTIYRDSLDTPWGFRLQGGKDFNTPLSVKRVFSGSPAVGQLTRDDLILAINDEPADALFHADVLEKIKSAGNSIVLTLQTSALESEFGYASKDHFRPIQDTRHQQQVKKPEETLQQKSYQAPSAIRHDAAPTIYEAPPTTYEPAPTTYEHAPTPYEPAPTPYEPPPPTTYETPATTYETSDPSHNRTAANAYGSKNAAHQSRHRSARRFQIKASALPSGLTEPGWTPRPKSVPRNLPLSAPQPAPPPSSQHRSQPAADDHQSAQYPVQRDFFKSESTAAEGSGVPAWYGSLRSTRAAHSWELRAAKVQIQAEQDSSDVAWKEPEQPQLHQAPKQQQVQQQQVQPQQVQQQQVEPEPGRTFKAEIRGLRLARPDYHQTQSTPAWEDAAEERQHHRSYIHSAPETPVADAAVHSETSPSAIYAQQTVESPPGGKLQPALLFGGERSSGRVVQQPSAAQSRVVVRAQPPTTKTAVSGVHTRQEVQVPATKGVAQLVTPATLVPVRQVGSAFQANPQVHPTTQPRTQEAVAKPSVQNLIQPSKEQQPSIAKVSAQPAKVTNLPETVERFNPGPDRREATQTQVKHVSVTKTAGKLSEAPVERFNPGPDRREATKAQVKHVSAPRTVGKLSEAPVERFNPGPDRREATQAQVKHDSVQKTLVKSSKVPVERFNPGPDRQNKA
jgi:hypothetical protein